MKKVALKFKNCLIRSLMKPVIDSLIHFKVYDYWELSDIVIFDPPFILTNYDEVLEISESGKILAMIDYDLTKDEILIYLKLLPIKGILFKDMDAKLLEKFLLAISEGEVWIKRDLIYSLIREDIPLDSFSLKELKIIYYLLQAYTNKQIARELGLTEQSIKYYVNHLLKRTRSSNRMELIIKFYKFKPLIKALLLLKEGKVGAEKG